jgi:serine phosphatase RsbU (regulator of sigma subunit)/anti-sigma regulatory factor (Ser/Thr protein kinase)
MVDAEKEELDNLQFSSGDDVDTRRQSLADIVTAASTDGLFAEVRKGLGLYGVDDFAIYVNDTEEASLAFSSGVAASEASHGADVIPIGKLEFLRSFLGGTAPFLVPGDDVKESLKELSLRRASVFIRMPGREGLMGFLVLFGELPDDLLAGANLGDFLTLIAVFAATFAQRRQMDGLKQSHSRTTSRLQEMQQGQDVLLLNERVQILEAVLTRACHLLGGHAGMLWLRRSGGWRLDYALGDPSIEAVEDMESVMQSCFEQGRPALINALSGEETWEISTDSIHMASVFVFPLQTREQKIGALAIFDATVSQEAIDILDSTALVGATALENWQNRQRSLKQHRLQEQLEIAAKAQQRLLPSKQATMLGLTSAHFSHYCDETGGDYVDAIPSRDPYSCSFLVGDVSGHGLGAAMLMVDVRARIRTHLETRPIWSPEDVLTSVNQVLCKESAMEEFVTLFLCSVDTRSGVLRYASAGHEPPLIYRPRFKTWEELPSTGLPLGMEEDAYYDVGKLRLQEGDIVVFATDGATEALNAEGKIFGTDSIQAIVESSPESTAEELLSLVVSKTLDHAEDRSFIDDVTYLLLKVDDIVLQIVEEEPKFPGRRIYADFFPSTHAAKDQQLEAVRRALQTRFPEANMDSIMMSVEEGLSNAVVHGNGLSQEKDVELAVWVSETEMAVVVGDLGEGFDPRRTMPDYVDERALIQEHGRGLLIMTSLMDRVFYWDDGRKIGLVKNMSNLDEF